MHNRNSNVVTPPASLGIRGDQLAHYSKNHGLEEPDFPVPYKYDHIHAYLCDADAPYT